jgi:hypothetical protein
MGRQPALLRRSTIVLLTKSGPFDWFFPPIKRRDRPKMSDTINVASKTRPIQSARRLFQDVLGASQPHDLISRARVFPVY